MVDTMDDKEKAELEEVHKRRGGNQRGRSFPVTSCGPILSLASEDERVAQVTEYKITRKLAAGRSEVDLALDLRSKARLNLGFGQSKVKRGQHQPQLGFLGRRPPLSHGRGAAATVRKWKRGGGWVQGGLLGGLVELRGQVLGRQ
ncbi:hypothetical protein NL676_033151 [Syzygium grande]|nr:hypothetical protein NL676_033151 [Syzygium grande]